MVTFSEFICSSQITHVTVYARGALVTRQVSLPAALLGSGTGHDGDHLASLELVVEGLTPLAEPGSLRAALLPSAASAAAGSLGSGVGAASVSSGWQIIAVRSALHIPETTAEPGPSAARVAEIGGRLQRAQAELERLQQQRQKLAKSIPEPALRTTSFVEKVDERIADALATTELFLEAQRRSEERLSILEREIADLQLSLAAAELEHSQSRSRLGQGHPTRRAIISLGGSGPLTGIALSLSYVVPAARFWPLYTLRIADSRDNNKESGRRATWVIEALVAQRTGEDWHEARLSLSTADLLLDARLPELPSLRLGKAQPPPRRGYRPPPAGLDELFSGYDRAFRDAPAAAPQAAAFDDDEQAEEGGALSQDVLESTAPDKDFSRRELRRRTSVPPAPAQAQAQALVPRNLPPPPPAAAMPPQGARSSGAMPLLGSSAAYAAPDGAMPPPAPAAPGGMPMASRTMAIAKARSGARAGGAMERSQLAVTLPDGAGGGGYGGAPDEEAEGVSAQIAEPQDAWLDFDRLSLCGPEDLSRRGRLLRTSESASLVSARQANEQLESLHPADGLSDPLTSRGHFDHRYDAEGLIRVPSDGLPHRVTLSSAATLPTMRLLTVPRERLEVYREAELKNPSEVPLLAGPVDVYLEGSLLTTAAITAIDRGGALNVGMGIEERVRVARNVRSDEENVGLLGGSTQVTSQVSIELSSALGQQCVVEVLERLPVSDDKSLSIELVAARPEPKEYSQAERGAPIRGGLVWRLLLPAGGKAKIEYQYRVLFPARTEIVGGNRRD